MVELKQLVAYCDELLNVTSYQDYCPNGLQVEGRKEVGRIISGVTASQALLDLAVKAEADLVLVHHGYFWKGEDPRIVGIKGRRIRTLLQHDISLLAYHLPLDGHAELGNNTWLGRLLGFPIDGRFLEGDIGMYGTLSEAMSLIDLANLIMTKLERKPLVIKAGNRPISKIAWCSGAAQGYLEEAARLGADAYISGEISEHTVHIARELGIHYIAAGHHATERRGIEKLGEHLAEQFDIEHEFFDIPNPV